MGMVDIFSYHTPERLCSPQVLDSSENGEIWLCFLSVFFSFFFFFVVSLYVHKYSYFHSTAGVKELRHVDRFRSRWLGGWTGWTRKVGSALLQFSSIIFILNSLPISFFVAHVFT